MPFSYLCTTRSTHTEYLIDDAGHARNFLSRFLLVENIIIMVMCGTSSTNNWNVDDVVVAFCVVHHFIKNDDHMAFHHIFANDWLTPFT